MPAVTAIAVPPVHAVVVIPVGFAVVVVHAYLNVCNPLATSRPVNNVVAGRELYQEPLPVYVMVGTAVSTLFCGDVHVAVLPTPFVIVTVHVLPLLVPVVHGPPDVVIPDSPSDPPANVKLCDPLAFHGLVDGVHVPPVHVGAVVSILYVP